MNGKKLLKVAFAILVIGLISFFVLVLSGVSYPNLLFRILAPVGFLLVCIGLCIIFISWLLLMKDAISSKKYGQAGSLFLVGIAIILMQVFREIIR